jgi:glycosyltransferase involved in cell wall biosynthesis
MTPTVSVILPTFERASLLEGVLKDLVSQPLQSVEVLVMDDGSKDDTADRVQAITDPRVSYWNFGKLGVSAIINEGFIRSSAPYIMLLHDHDQADPGLLSALADALDRHPTASFAFCGYAFFDSHLEVEQERWVFDHPEFLDGKVFFERELMPKLNSPVLAVSMVRRSAVHGVLLDPSIGGCSDVELWHRLCLTGDVCYVPKILLHIRGRDGSSQFSSPGATLDLMANILRVKHRFIEFVAQPKQAKMQKGWRRQIDRGAIYVAWKAYEANDLEVLKKASWYVSLYGSTLGKFGFRSLLAVPPPIAKSLLNVARSISRLRKRSTI